jgi:50S ribosomal protein L16 3-hydroxylase
MVSYAADGGGVGPHDDLYDVFLLQGPGRRRWRLSTQRDRRLDPDAAIKVLADFRAEEEHVLEAGDMLYLPPGVAHHGIAEGGPCFTYSIGFLAPAWRDLRRELAAYLAATMDPEALYADPDLRPPRDPLELGDVMVARVAGRLAGVRWTRADVADFLGRYLTMPRARARFAPPRRPLAPEAFARRLRGRGRLTLALPTRALARRGRLFVNGEAHPASPAVARALAPLLRGRALPLPLARGVPAAAVALLHAWYAAGYLGIS